MNYELRSSTKKNKISTPLKITFIISIFLIIMYFIFPLFFSSFITAIISPVWKINTPKYVNTEQIQKM